MKKYFVFAMGMLWVSCGEDDPLDVAWSKFRNNDYAGAHQAFAELTSSRPEAWVGLGWTAMRMDSMPQANVYFANAASDSIVDGYAGWAIADWWAGDNAGVVSGAQFVLRRSPAYVFAHDRTVTARDMQMKEAYAEYRLGNYARVAQIIGSLTGTTPGTGPDELLTELEDLFGSAG